MFLLFTVISCKCNKSNLTKNNNDSVSDTTNVVKIDTVNHQKVEVIEEESKNGSLIITTAEELKIYHTIKTILIHRKEIDADRISYRDQKNSFNILVDDNNKKIICKILCSKNKYYIELNGLKYEVSGIDSIVAIKKQLLTNHGKRFL